MPVLNTNSIQTAVPGIDFSTDGLNWVIAPGVTASSDTANGVNSTRGQSELINHGKILSGALDGVQFVKDAVIINAADGSITGGRNGINLATASNGVALSVANMGSIVGGLFGVNSSGLIITSGTVDNSGYIFGQMSGIDWTANVGLIINSGVIESLFRGLRLSNFDGSPLYIVENSGTIKGNTAAILVSSGGISLTNTGLLAGNILCSTGVNNDVIINAGTIKGLVNLGGGADLFVGTGGTSGAINGENGIDNLTGGSGADRISGGLANDTLTGAGGKDHFLFDYALAANIDRIVDFSVPQDTIDLSHAIFAATNAAGVLAASMFFRGAAAHDATDRIIYNPANGFVTYDSNGNAAGGAVHFATLAAHLTVTNADFLCVA